MKWAFWPFWPKTPEPEEDVAELPSSADQTIRLDQSDVMSAIHLYAKAQMNEADRESAMNAVVTVNLTPLSASVGFTIKKSALTPRRLN